MQLRFAALAAARAYRVQLAADPAFQAILGEKVVDVPEARFGGLPDGDYHLRVRGIDAQGLEGMDAVRRIALRARPEPPFPSAPADGAKVRGDAATLRWAAMVEADSYLLQLAADDDGNTVAHLRGFIQIVGDKDRRAMFLRKHTR